MRTVPGAGAQAYIACVTVCTTAAATLPGPAPWQVPGPSRGGMGLVLAYPGQAAVVGYVHLRVLVPAGTVATISAKASKAASSV